ncbi:MAG: succinylglutamate desuccinylase/aspartoacylase family protein, partial [Pseudomonadota bacterium]|nr:succinylglutamate desuccinylase/aspartoacylase family protein [Pseudomonadota bacterium]
MSYQLYSHTLPSATPGTHRIIKAHHFGEAGAHPKIYFQAGLHADEWPGFLVLNTLIKKLIEADEKGLIKGEIIIVPVANPIGLGQNFHGYIPGRFAFSDGGGNFNRNWPQLGSKIENQIQGNISGDVEENIAIVRQAIKKELAQLPELTELQGLRKTLLALSMDADEVIDLHCSGEACMHAYV